MSGVGWCGLGGCVHGWCSPWIWNAIRDRHATRGEPRHALGTRYDTEQFRIHPQTVNGPEAIRNRIVSKCAYRHSRLLIRDASVPHIPFRNSSTTTTNIPPV